MIINFVVSKFNGNGLSLKFGKIQCCNELLFGGIGFASQILLHLSREETFVHFFSSIIAVNVNKLFGVAQVDFRIVCLKIREYLVIVKVCIQQGNASHPSFDVHPTNSV